MSNLAKEKKENALVAFYEQNPQLEVRGIDESTWNALQSTIYPGAAPESILLAVDYCKARGLDVMLKPVHLVPMNVKDAKTGQYSWRDVPMPGIGMYRIQADRSGSYAGADEPEFGPLIKYDFTDKSGKPVTMQFPEWCKFTVHKLIGDRIVSFSAKEYWLENYATDSGKSDAPNAMWRKRVYGQLAKCAEAQALRKAWPEVGSDPTVEEMEGKSIEREINPVRADEKNVDPKALHSKLVESPITDDATQYAQETDDNVTDEFYPSEKAAELAEWVFAAEDKEQLHSAASKINEALANEEISQQDREWLTHGYKAKQQELS